MMSLDTELISANETQGHFLSTVVLWFNQMS